MEHSALGHPSPQGEFPRAQFLAMTADLPIFVTLEPVEIPFATFGENYLSNIQMEPTRPTPCTMVAAARGSFGTLTTNAWC